MILLTGRFYPSKPPKKNQVGGGLKIHPLVGKGLPKFGGFGGLWAVVWQVGRGTGARGRNHCHQEAVTSFADNEVAYSVPSTYEVAHVGIGG